jgi:ATP-binding cassette subfamily B protein
MASGMALIGLVDAIFLSTMSLFFMFSINPRLTLYTIIPLPLIILILTKTGKIIQKRHLDVQKSFDAISSHTQESISGVRVLKSFVQEQHENNRFTTLCNHYAKANLSLVKIWGFLFPSITLLGSLSLSILLFFGSKLVILQELTIGQFVSFTFYINLLIWPMIATGWVFNMIQRGIASSKRVLELMETKSDVWVHPVKSTDDPIKGKIEIRNLSFSYASDSKRVLSDISFTIERGSSLGIIGKPGSGKSTLASLLFHLYPVDQGCIFIDDTDVNHIKLPILRSSISYVPQDSSLFSDTIKENIGFGVKYDITQDNIESAAKSAAVHKDIMSFSHGYSTQIGERGITLSGGQKQRLAIARAILTDSPILILDDALSAVDSATEKQILLSIDDIIRKRTTIMIAHRISTVKNCDSIIVLSEGKITERGSHSELLELDGFYARLYNLQKIRETAQ